MHSLYAYLIHDIDIDVDIDNPDLYANVDEEILQSFWLRQTAAAAVGQRHPDFNFIEWNDWFEGYAEKLKPDYAKLTVEQRRALIQEHAQVSQLEDQADGVLESWRWYMDTALDENNWSSGLAIVTHNGIVGRFTENDDDYWVNMLHALPREQRWDYAWKLAWEVAVDDWLDYGDVHIPYAPDAFSNDARHRYYFEQYRQLMDKLSEQALAHLRAPLNEEDWHKAFNREWLLFWRLSKLTEIYELIAPSNRRVHMPFAYDLKTPYFPWRALDARGNDSTDPLDEHAAILLVDIHT